MVVSAFFGGSGVGWVCGNGNGTGGGDSLVRRKLGVVADAVLVGVNIAAAAAGIRVVCQVIGAIVPGDSIGFGDKD